MSWGQFSITTKRTAQASHIGDTLSIYTSICKVGERNEDYRSDEARKVE